jgi:hypothetical protein
MSALRMAELVLQRRALASLSHPGLRSTAAAAASRCAVLFHSRVLVSALRSFFSPFFLPSVPEARTVRRQATRRRGERADQLHVILVAGRGRGAALSAAGPVLAAQAAQRRLPSHWRHRLAHLRAAPGVRV